MTDQTPKCGMLAVRRLVSLSVFRVLCLWLHSPGTITISNMAVCLFEILAPPKSAGPAGSSAQDANKEDHVDDDQDQGDIDPDMDAGEMVAPPDPEQVRQRGRPVLYGHIIQVGLCSGHIGQV